MPPTDSSDSLAGPTTDRVTSPVVGTVVDFWGQPIAGVVLDVGGVVALTDSSGRFEAAEVPQLYDVSLVVQVDGEAAETYGWTFEGLTRRDPVLQVYRGLPPRRANVVIAAPAMDAGVASRCGIVAVGGTDGHDVADYAVPFVFSTVWRGSVSADRPVHLLTWQPANEDCAEFPSTLRHASSTFRFVPNVEVDVSPLLEQGREAPVSTRLVGTLGEPALDAGHSPPSLTVFARYDSGPTLPLLEVPESFPEFDVTVPTLESARLVVAASRGGLGAGSFAVWAVTDPAPAPGELSLQVPDVPTLLTPNADSDVAVEETLFQWAGPAQVSLLAFVHDDPFVSRFVVTRADSSSLRDLSHLGMEWRPGPATWSVEVHGAVRDVDEWTARAGVLSPFSADFRMPLGPSRADGPFARSEPSGVRAR